MSSNLYQRAHQPDVNGFTVDITPNSAGWRYSSLRILELRANRTCTFSTGESEWIVLPLRGTCVVTCGKDTFDLEGRGSVFSRVTDFAYVPRDASVTIHSSQGGRFALTGARARRALPARYGAAEDVPVELRGTGSASRQANNFASPEGFETDRLIAVEVLTPGGNWSSYPPHKHDKEGPGEAMLEEIYYFEVHGGAGTGRPGPGGYQRVYSSAVDREIDVLAEVSTGDTILIPYGYHGPTMAAPGYDLYFLNVLAGESESRTMAFCDDPAHAWVRDSWKSQPVDPRLPLTTHRGSSCD
ncbi:MAG TPA: 5-deoxy-glucuronate isomerase [Acidimicrobiales bacterium]|nr:5-deoxy-glucuronate isomerase [Acidimicrobiales bacterium]